MTSIKCGQLFALDAEPVMQNIVPDWAFTGVL